MEYIKIIKVIFWISTKIFQIVNNPYYKFFKKNRTSILKMLYCLIPARKNSKRIKKKNFPIIKKEPFIKKKVERIYQHYPIPKIVFGTHEK